MSQAKHTDSNIAALNDKNFRWVEYCECEIKKMTIYFYEIFLCVWFNDSVKFS